MKKNNSEIQKTAYLEKLEQMFTNPDMGKEAELQRKSIEKYRKQYYIENGCYPDDDTYRINV